MNGELMNMAQLTLAAEHYLKTGSFPRQLTESKQITGYEFQFAPLGEEEAKATADCEEWARELKARGVSTVKLLIGDEVDDFRKLALPNALPCVIFCFHEDDSVTAWSRLWQLNPFNGTWFVRYEEKVIENAPSERPRFGDVSQDMVRVLERIRALAQKLELSDFAFQFRIAQKSLQANFVGDKGLMEPAHRRLLQAATEAFVFTPDENGWQEKGRAAAEQKGLLEEYQSLTKELYRGIALSIMYAVNEL